MNVIEMGSNCASSDMAIMNYCNSMIYVCVVLSCQMSVGQCTA